MDRYKATRLDEIALIDDGRVPMRPVRAHFGISSFGATAWTVDTAGDRIINEHDEDEEDGQEELYFVHSGHARFEVDGETVDAPAGTFVFVPSKVTRTAFAEEAGTTILALGGTPGKAYDNPGWEIWSPLRGLYESGDYPELVKQGRELLETQPDSPLLYYNLACCESLNGDKAEAMAHLRGAVERSDRFRSYAAGDSDFDAIRDEPGFKELVGQT
jgi:tetratricopeptide (TPR) repeat protein